MKSIVLALIINVLISPLILSQNWTEPVNISNMPGLDNMPDLCIDSNGVLHCVFTHKLDNNWRKILYSKSVDNGVTWTDPVDISLNDELSMMRPHIVAGEDNTIYVSWDYNSGNTFETRIYFKKCKNGKWEGSYCLTPQHPASKGNKLVLDFNKRLYCFWSIGSQNPITYYRYLENNGWSEVFCPYPGNHYWATAAIAVDKNNNLHCIGAYHEEGMPHTKDHIIYFWYDHDENTWSDKTLLTDHIMMGDRNMDIDVDNENNPHLTWKQRTYGILNDSTIYIFYNGETWSEPDVVVADPYEQRIEIDNNDNVHIIDMEKIDTGYKLVHYQKYNNIWQGLLVDSSKIITGNPSPLFNDNQLYLVYHKCFSDEDCRIRFSSFQITTNYKWVKGLLNDINIYPNPSNERFIIEFETTSGVNYGVTVYDIYGRHIKKLKTTKISPGMYRAIWNGKGKNGKEVKAGLYLVRLQSGRKVVTKGVEIIK